MPSQKNQQQVASLKTQLEGAKSVIFADYQGLTVAQMGDLRDKVREATGEFAVAKNTLLRLVLKEKLKGLPRDLEEVLRGPTAILIAKEDEISPLKAVAEFAKDAELPKIKAGIFRQPGSDGEDKILTAQEVNQLAKLPSKKELQAKLVGILKGPLYGLVNVLSGNTRKLIYVLEAIRKQKKPRQQAERLALSEAESDSAKSKGGDS